jgi:transcription elongation GreA/GreB family factor
MNKIDLIDHLKNIVKQNLVAAHQAAMNTYDIATHEDNKAENKYDTRGLEASYLAGAQAERVSDIKAILASYEILKIQNFSDDSKVALSALIKMSSNDKEMFVLLMPKGGGQVLNFDGHHIQVITPDSPLGKNLIGKEVGEIIKIGESNKPKEYEILSLQ